MAAIISKAEKRLIADFNHGRDTASPKTHITYELSGPIFIHFVLREYLWKGFKPMTAAQKRTATPVSGSDNWDQAQRDMQSRPDIVEPSPVLHLPSVAGSNGTGELAKRTSVSNSQSSTFNPQCSITSSVALLTAGRDKPYALGLAAALATADVTFDFIGSDGLDSPELHGNPRIRFLNLRGDQSMEAGPWQKISRVLTYYFRLLTYAATSKPKIFHILWNNKFEWFDRTALMLYYRLLGKKIVFTAHNVNIGERDGTDSSLNRRTLKFQYRMCDHIFVHTARMKEELVSGFGVESDKVSVIPFGINRTVPDTTLTAPEARQRLGLTSASKVVLFFGNIAPYKGLEFLIEAFEALAKTDQNLRLVVAGRPKGSEDYWAGLLEKINHIGARDRMILKIEYVPDAETEIYFKAADVLVLPYTHIYQSGVLSLGYGFGLPVIAADVGSLKEEIVEGKTGFTFRAKDSPALVQALKMFFSSGLFENMENTRPEIKDYANDRYSWRKVATVTTQIYSKLLNDV